MRQAWKTTGITLAPTFTGRPGSAPPHVPDREGVGDPAGGIAVDQQQIGARARCDPAAVVYRATNLVRFTEAPRGGHFAPREEPEFYAEELRAFFRPYRA
jgi:pimeloyl-ACP methyl ester carboxylesterase